MFMKNVIGVAMLTGLCVAAALLQTKTAMAQCQHGTRRPVSKPVGNPQPIASDSTIDDLFAPPLAAPTNARPPKPLTLELDPAELEFVERLRSAFGSPTDDSIFQGETSAAFAADRRPDDASRARYDDFRQAYRKLSATCSEEIEVEDLEAASASDEVLEAAAWPAHPPVAFDPAAAMSNSLRLSARQLEATAADLEDQADYERADKLRQLAHRLRLEARDSQ
jgi:hypothetical protein